MGTVQFLDDPPFQLRLTKLGTAGAVDASVLVTLPVYSRGSERDEREIQVLMQIGEARHLSRDLERAAGIADQHLRGVSR